MYEYLQIGKIVNTHGVKGYVKTIPLTDNPKRFSDLEWVYIQEKDSLKKLFIESVKYLKSFVLVKFKGIDNLNEALLLKGLFILVDRKNAVQLPKDTYFICDLIGIKVYDEKGDELGSLTDVLQTGSNDVYMVKDRENKEILVPALKSVVKRISLEEKRMEVALPEGLLND